MAHHKRKKKRTHLKNKNKEQQESSKIPKSFVMRSGKVSKSISQLVRNIRTVMEPNTATRLKETKKNRLKDFLSVSGQMGVTHFMILSQTTSGTQLRFCRTPQGPTMTFRVHSYSLIRDVIHGQQKPKSPGIEFLKAPLLVMNQFQSQDMHVKFMSTMIQNMFPPLNVEEMEMKECRRIVLFHYDKETEMIEFRHYSIQMKPLGLTRGIQKVLENPQKDLHQYEDIGDFIQQQINYESDGEVVEKEQKAIRLVELGPRMKLKLLKIELGFCQGEVMYHALIQKTPEEIELQKKERERKLLEKQKRKEEQEKNVLLKQQKLEQHKQKCAQGQQEQEKEVEEEEPEEEEDFDENDLDFEEEDEDAAEEESESEQEEEKPKKKLKK